MNTRVAILVLAALSASVPLPAGAQTSTHGMTIPAGSPVPLLWTSGRTTAACGRYNSSPSTYPLLTPASDPARAMHQATVYKCTGTFTAANGGTIDTTGDAKAWVLDDTQSGWYYGTNSLVSSNLGNGNNYARWNGEARIYTFITLWSEFTSSERDAVITDINRAIGSDYARLWGASDDPFNNYNWGYSRNGILWAIATYNVSFTMPSTSCSWSGYISVNYCSQSQTDTAEEILDEALDVRFDGISDYMDSWAGGVPPDGTHYGKYLLDYMTMPMIVMADYGRTAITETNWWLESAWRVLYGTTPKTTYHTNTTLTGFQLFSHGDQQDTGGTTPAATSETANFLTYAVTYWDGTALEGYIRKWLTDHNPVRISHIKLIDADLGAAGTALSSGGSQPTDYYAPGPGHLYLRDTLANGGGDKPTVFLLQLGRVDGSHMDADGGSWQAWRNGQWVSKEAASYATAIVDETGSGAVDASYVWAQNGITVNNFDYSASAVFNNVPVISRLTRTTDYTHATTNLLAYSGVTASALLREFVYVPAMDTIVKLDRVGKSSTSIPATDIVHCPTNPPAVSSDTLVCTVGNEVLRSIFLSGSVTGQSVAYTEIDESGGGTYPPSGSRDPQYRLQAAVTGTTTAHLVSVHQALSSGDAEVGASLAEDGDSLTITLTLAGASSVVIDFIKGTSSSGGTISIGGGSAVSFGTTVDTLTVDSSGVTWD